MEEFNAFIEDLMLGELSVAKRISRGLGVD